MRYILTRWVRIVFIAIILCVNLFFLYAQAQNTDLEQTPSLNIESVYLKNPETGKYFQALLVTHPQFNYSFSHEQGFVLSMGAYGLEPPYDQTFFEEFTTWVPLIADYLNRQPQGAVVVPDSGFYGPVRAGALAACADYLTDSMNNISIQYLALLAGSLGSRGGLYFLEHSQRYPSAAKVIAASFASPREFAEDDLAQENIGKLTASIGIYVGTSAVDPESNLDAYALHDAITLYNFEHDPDIKEKLEEYINGRHGFYKSYKDNPVGQDGDAAREDSYYFFQRACRNSKDAKQGSSFKKWRP